MVSVGSSRMKRTTRSFVDKVLRSGKRLFADRYEEELKRAKIMSLALLDTQVKKIKLLDCCMEIDNNVQVSTFKLGEINKVNVNPTNEVPRIGDNHDNASRIKRFGCVYTRKQKRVVQTDKMYEQKYFKKKKVRVSFESGFDGKYDLKKGPFVFAASCGSDCRFSCFVSSVLRYLRMDNYFSWRRFSSFLLLESGSSGYCLIGRRFMQDSTYTTSHGLFKVFGSTHSIPSFTLNFNSLPFCFLYIHLNLLLKHAFLSYSSLTRLTDKNATNHDLKTPSIDTLKRNLSVDKPVVAKKARSARKRIPRVSLFNNFESIVPVPGVREIAGYTEDCEPFVLPESYIRTSSDEVSRTLEKSYAVYDMDSDDEQWLKKSNHECVSEDVFEKVIDAFERGIYCSPHDYSEAALAVDRCLELASKEVLEHVYSYWMAKRKKKRSALIRVFQCYKQKRVKRHFTSVVFRKKRSFRRRASWGFAEKQFDFKKAMLNDEKLLEDSTKANIKMLEIQEAAKRSEEASIFKRQQAQALMLAADMAVYKATMALKIAETLAAGCSVDPVGVASATFGFLVD